MLIVHAADAGPSRAGAGSGARVASQNVQPMSASAAPAAAPAAAAPVAPEPPAPPPPPSSETCRATFRECMDAFCLADPLDGERCICSDDIRRTESLQREIEEINQRAERIRHEDVARAQMTAREQRLLADTQRATATADRRTRLLAMWNEAPGGNSDETLGAALLAIARSGCATRLAACGPDARMEENLYSRMIADDCRTFNRYLADMKRGAEDNVALAQREVRQARQQMLTTSDRFNRGECMHAFRDCVATKGGCGMNFENCADRRLITRRAHACENILDECNSVRDYVMRDWNEEVRHLLELATVHNDQNVRRTCRARTWDCLEESCGIQNNAQCLTNINVAAGICTMIAECDTIIPGFRRGIADDLGMLRNRFCQNDVTRCLQERCGINFTNPECVGQSVTALQDMCPRRMFPSCNSVTAADFTALMSAATLQMDFALMTGCVNHFAESVGRICGTDMSCLPANPDIQVIRATNDSPAAARRALEQLEALYRPEFTTDNRTGNEIRRSQIQEWVDNEVDVFMRQLERDRTVAACQGSIGDNIFIATRMMARANTEERVMREYFTRVAELSRGLDQAERRRLCEVEHFGTLQAANRGNQGNREEAGSWVISAVYEPDTRNCRILRRQRVCATFDNRASARAEGRAAGMTAGAALGTTIAPGIGTAIGALGGAIIGNQQRGTRQVDCNTIEVWDSINM